VSKDQIIAELVAEKSQLSADNISLNADNISLKHELSQLKKLIWGAKSEKHRGTNEIDDQLNIFGQSEDANADSDAAEKEKVEISDPITYTRSKPNKKHPGRHPLPSHLPVEEVTIEPQEDTEGLTKISEEITDTLEYTPASLVIKRTIRPKYAVKDGQGVLIGKLPSRPLPKSIAESSLLTHIFVSKFVNHLPFYRQRQIFKRDYQWKISSSTINDWFIQSCTLLDPLYKKLQQIILSSGYIQADESPIKVQDKEKKGKTHQGYQWVYHAPLEKLILFNYRKGRGMHGPKEILSNYQGILQCDGYTVYDKIGKIKGITLAGCLVHVRRYFVQALDSDKSKAKYALDLFSRMYAAEKLAKESTDRKAYREKHIRPLLMELRKWIEVQSIHVLPKSPIGKAMKYTVSQWDKLINIFKDGRIELDNNLIENKIRPLALGRKNYLFAGSHAAGQRIAMMYSFFASCAANNVNPSTWLNHVLDNIPETSIQDLDQLLPHRIKL
jgi:transposase